jgi:AraC family transcriptional regulator
MDIVFLPPLSTFGRPLAQREFEGFAVSLGSHPPRETIPVHRHQDTYQWCLTLEGGFEEFVGARVAACGAGSLLIRPPDCVHANRFSGMRGICLNLFPRAAWLDKHGFAGLSDTYVHQRTRRLWARGREIAAALRRADAHSACEVEALVLELLSSATRLDDLTRQGHPPWLAAAVDFIETHPDKSVGLGELARCTGVSAGHLARAFRARFGKSVGAFARERRLARAAALLRESRQPLAEVGAAAGFYDQAHFTRAFKAQFGITPAAFRQQ